MAPFVQTTAGAQVSIRAPHPDSMMPSEKERFSAMSEPVPGRVFISYRRQDARGSAGRIYDRCADRFGSDQVFMDVDNLPPGADFNKEITQAVSQCRVLLAIIGPRWLDAKERRRRRLDDPGDLVRMEIAAALTRDILVIPILVEDADMPRSHELPGNLVGLAGRNAHRVRHESFRSDVDQLLTAIEPILRAATTATVTSPKRDQMQQAPKAPPDRRKTKRPRPKGPSQAPPQMLLDRYEVGRLLGAGGMAEVYEGRDRLLRRRVAIKVLRAQYARDPSFLLRFKREAQTAASLSHPNIAMVTDIGPEDGTHFIVMEYVDGRTLSDVIRAEGPLYPERAAEITADVCSALDAAHARGLIHRDIKPGNIMLTPDGKVKVMDIGIARATTSETIIPEAAVVSDAQYISPEQAQGHKVDYRSDIYSLGCCLYEMLTGTAPFTGATPVAIAYRHVREDPTPPRQLNQDVPARLEAICLKAMAKLPDNRYQTAAELRADLERYRNGQPVQANQWR
jgi:tRNA A-37 threonylcarbamoyl transferase component Bud32